jgi:hypothetical protein
MPRCNCNNQFRTQRMNCWHDLEQSRSICRTVEISGSTPASLGHNRPDGPRACRHLTKLPPGPNEIATQPSDVRPRLASGCGRCTYRGSFVITLHTLDSTSQALAELTINHDGISEAIRPITTILQQLHKYRRIDQLFRTLLSCNPISQRRSGRSGMRLS